MNQQGGDMKGYDIIGDIHGHAEELVKLLKHLGYSDSVTGYQHPERKVIFVGDFIDRGERLRQHKALLNIVMLMVDNGHALAVMGNHEFNALAFHTTYEGKPLRSHNEAHIRQHKAFINEFDEEPVLKQQVLDFFYRLPLWLEIDGLRIIHACWHDEHIQTMRSLTTNNLLTEELLFKATVKGTAEHEAIEVLLKGVEVKLPEGTGFHDKDGNSRHEVRVQWWKTEAKMLKEVALPFGVNLGDAAEVPFSMQSLLPPYASEYPPCFIGHYWLEGEPEPLKSNVACLDYSIAKNGKLVAYRWNGERALEKDNFTHV